MIKLTENPELDVAISNLQSMIDPMDLKLGLKKIHAILKEQEELIYILTEEQIGILFKSLEEARGIYLQQSKTPKKKATLQLGDLDI